MNKNGNKKKNKHTFSQNFFIFFLMYLFIRSSVETFQRVRIVKRWWNIYLMVDFSWISMETTQIAGIWTSHFFSSLFVFFCFRIKLLSVYEFNSNSMVWLPSIFATYCDAVTGSLISAFQSKLVAIIPCSNGTNRQKIVAFFMKKQKNKKRILKF